MRFMLAIHVAEDAWDGLTPDEMQAEVDAYVRAVQAFDPPQEAG